MKIKLPKKLKVCFIPEEVDGKYAKALNETYSDEVQVLDKNRLVLLFTDKSKKRLRRNEHLLSPGLILMTGEDNEENR